MLLLKWSDCVVFILGGKMEEIKNVKEELKEKVESLQYFYDPRIIRYLNALLDLQKSVLDDEVLRKNEVELLAATGLFRKIIRYNLYHGLIECYKRKASKINMLNLLEIRENDYDEYSANNMGIYLRDRNDYDYYKLVDFKREKDTDFKPDHIDISINEDVPSPKKEALYSEFTNYFMDKATIYDNSFQVENLELDKTSTRVLTKNYNKMNISLKINKYDV